MPESVFIQLHLSKACWEIRLFDDQPHSDYNGQWQRPLCVVAVPQSSQPNQQRNKKWENPWYKTNQQRVLTPGHQGWNDVHSLCRIGMEYYLLNNDDNNIIYWVMMIIIMMMSSMNIEFHLWYENYRRHFQIYLQWKCLNFNYNMYNFTEVYSQGSNWL